RAPAHNDRYITNASTNPAVGCWKAPGKRPTISNPKLFHNRTARSLVLTTKLNCMARNPHSLARSRECAHMARATPRPDANGAVMYPQLAPCAPPPCWLARRKYVPTTAPLSSATKTSCPGANHHASAASRVISRDSVYVSPARIVGSRIDQIASASEAVAARTLIMRAI